jgi:hypothetical protein
MGSTPHYNNSPVDGFEDASQAIFLRNIQLAAKFVITAISSSGQT